MKTIFLTFFLLITGVTYSQIHYIEVSSTAKSHDPEEGYYDNIHLFSFSLNASEYWRAKSCTITGYIYNIPLNNSISAKTGWDFEYKEYNTQTDSMGWFKITISTDNLPKLGIGVNYNGELLPDLKLSNVDIYFSGSKY